MWWVSATETKSTKSAAYYIFIILNKGVGSLAALAQIPIDVKLIFIRPKRRNNIYISVIVGVLMSLNVCCMIIALLFLFYCGYTQTRYFLCFYIVCSEVGTFHLFWQFERVRQEYCRLISGTTVGLTLCLCQFNGSIN